MDDIRNLNKTLWIGLSSIVIFFTFMFLLPKIMNEYIIIQLIVYSVLTFAMGIVSVCLRKKVNNICYLGFYALSTSIPLLIGFIFLFCEVLIPEVDLFYGALASSLIVVLVYLIFRFGFKLKVWFYILTGLLLVSTITVAILAGTQKDITLAMISLGLMLDFFITIVFGFSFTHEPIRVYLGIYNALFVVVFIIFLIVISDGDASFDVAPSFDIDIPNKVRKKAIV